ncbi:MAG: hypothetical protein U0939_27135 [Pirellulales bacterium]
MGVVKASPDALPRPLAEMVVIGGANRRGADRGGDAVGDDAREEPQETSGRNTQPSDLVGEPDAKGASATGASMAVAAEDAASAKGFAMRAGLVEAVEKTVANEGADHPAVGAWHQLEPQDERVPFVVVAAKPTLLAHDRPPPPENRRL